ncbi:MAG: metalloregulator ArsR/SmtB family transcription factor [Bryobacterales bacterium]|jgi:DNA-binding transcriptional ArsR family regulator|nr:metalloregulator ArsR/SmtB family transcription factor [Bryobacterales bacterium]
MPASAIANKQLATVLGVLSHPLRIRMVQELYQGERDVNTLQQCVGISHSSVSQHLAVMRANRLVVERREGRRVFYRLVEPLLANWLLEGLRFLEVAEQRYDSVRLAVSQARQSWAGAAAVNGPDSSDE